MRNLSRKPGFLPASLLIAMAATPAVSGVLAGALSVVWSAIGAALILSGLLVIRCARGRLLTAPFLMLGFCSVGMVAGLALDRMSLPPGGLAALCLGGTAGFGAATLRHLATLPAMHALMLLGGTATLWVIERRARRMSAPRCRRALCARAGFNLACNAAMLAGMTGGGGIGSGLAGPAGPAAMLATMAGGMVWGMVAMMLIYRFWFAVRDFHRAPLACGVEP
jgi:hypothetical protein